MGSSLTWPFGFPCTVVKGFRKDPATVVRDEGGFVEVRLVSGGGTEYHRRRDLEPRVAGAASSPPGSPVERAPIDFSDEAAAARTAAAVADHERREAHAVSFLAEARRPWTPAPRAAPALVSQPKPPGPHRDAEHLAHVRSLPCAYHTEVRGPSDPHHYGPRGKGQKTDDDRTVPLCRECHDQFHDRRTIGVMDVRQTREWILDQLLTIALECRRALRRENRELRRENERMANRLRRTA